LWQTGGLMLLTGRFLPLIDANHRRWRRFLLAGGLKL
jgi:hypothetical protein